MVKFHIRECDCAVVAVSCPDDEERDAGKYACRCFSISIGIGKKGALKVTNIRLPNGTWVQGGAVVSSGAAEENIQVTDPETGELCIVTIRCDCADKEH